MDFDRARVAAVATRLFAEGSWMGRTMQRLRPYICPFDVLVNVVPERATILDVGCGSGLLLGLVAELRKPSAAVGFDANRRAIRSAQAMRDRLSPAVRPRISFLHRDVHQPWPEGLFEVVCLVDVLHHIPPRSQRDVIAQAATKVAPGGMLLYKDIAPRPLWRASANRLHDLVVAREWVHFRTIDTVAGWLSRKGLTTERTQRINQLWYGHELGIFRREAAHGVRVKSLYTSPAA